VNFSQKLRLFLILSTEVERVRESECSRMRRKRAVCTRVSAVCRGHSLCTGLKRVGKGKAWM
jgi:hypothetical protein